MSRRSRVDASHAWGCHGSGITKGPCVLGAAFFILMVHTSTTVAEAPAERCACQGRIWTSAGLGLAVGLAPAEFETELLGLVGSVEYNGPTQLKLIQTLGYYLLRRQWGPAVALELQESIGSDHFLFQVVPRVFWEFPLLRQHGLNLAPGFGLGYVHFSRQAKDPGSEGSGNGLTLQFSLEGRLVLAERVLLLLRLIEIDLQSLSLSSGQVQDWGTFIRYDMLIGGGLVF